MIRMTLTLPLLIALAYAPAQASATPVLTDNFTGVAVFSYTYFTSGANAKIFGNILSGGVSTTGASSSVNGSLTSVNAATTGASSIINGMLISGGVATTGANATVNGDLIASGAATLGAGSKISGSMTAGGVTTTGDAARVGGDVLSADTATVGANSSVIGTVQALGLVTISDSATTGATSQLASPPLTPATLTAAIQADVAAMSAMLLRLQTALTALTQSSSSLAATMTKNTTLTAGDYSAASWSTAADTVLTLDGQKNPDQSWVFNITDVLAFGAGSSVVLTNAGVGDSVIWNVYNGYASLGDGAKVTGTIIAKNYVSVGANASVFDPGTLCNGVYSQTSYVSTGDSASIGGSACNNINYSAEANDLASPASLVPEPTSCAMMLAGLGLLGFTMRRKSQA